MVLIGPTSSELEEIQKFIENFKRKFDSETDAIIARTSREDTKNTTVIHGGYPWETCFREACYLAKYIYRYKGKEKQDETQPQAAGSTAELNPNFFTEHPEEMAKIEEKWELWGDLVNDDSGLVAGLYKQKDYDPESETDLCPPTLVFRGTDFEDMRGLAILAKIHSFVNASPLPPLPFWMNFSLSPEVKIAQGKKQAAAQTGEPLSAREEELASSEGWGFGFYGGGRDRKNFKREGYEEFKIYDRFSATAIKIGEIGPIPYYASATFNLSFYIYAKTDGDWANNIRQGLGRESKQYTNAIKFGRKVIEEKIQSSKDKRLTVTGHSLGGGLASAVCCVLNAEYAERDNITVQSIIFNAAGVHKNTIARELKSENHTTIAMANNPCIDICVRDEILTTLGVHYKKLPFLGGVFTLVKREIGQYGFPNPSDIAKVTDIKAISPGTAVELAKNGTTAAEFPPRGAALPILFPIDAQNVALPPEKGFPVIQAIDGILNASPDIGTLATGLFDFLNERYGKAARQKSNYPWESYQEMLTQFKEEITPELKVLEPVLALCAAYHGMDVVISSYENMLAESKLTEDQKMVREKTQQDQLKTWQKPQWDKEMQRRQTAEAQRAYEIQMRQYQNYQLRGDELQKFFNMRF